MKKGFRWVVLTLWSLLFFAFIYLPLGVIVVYAFNAHPVNMMLWWGFTFDWYLTIFGMSDLTSDRLQSTATYVDSAENLIAALKNSVIVAGFTTTISTVLGTATAIALARHRFGMRRFYNGMDDLVITYFIAGVDSTTLPLFIFSMMRRGVKPEINAIATLIILFSLIVASIGLWLKSRSID